MNSKFARFIVATITSIALTASFVDIADARGFSGGGSRGFSAPSPSRGFSASPSPSRSNAPSSGGWFKPAAPAPQPTFKPSPTPAPQPTAPSPSFKPQPQNGYANSTTKAMQQQESKQAFEASKQRQQQAQAAQAQPLQQTQARQQTAQATAANTAGASAQSSPRYDSRDEHIRDLRRQLSSERYNSRQWREEAQFQAYHNRPSYFSRPMFGDTFNSPFFWLWLMDRPQHDRDRWIYDHQSQLDSARLAEMRAKDAELDSRLHALEQASTPRVATSVPPGLEQNPDLMYGNDAAKKVYEDEHSTSWGWIVFFLLVGGTAVYFVFFYRGFNRK